MLLKCFMLAIDLIIMICSIFDNHFLSLSIIRLQLVGYTFSESFALKKIVIEIMLQNVLG